MQQQKPKWKNHPLTTIEVPAKYAEQLLKIAHVWELKIKVGDTNNVN